MYTRILKKLGRKLQTILVVLAVIGLNVGTASAVLENVVADETPDNTDGLVLSDNSLPNIDTLDNSVDKPVPTVAPEEAAPVEENTDVSEQPSILEDLSIPEDLQTPPADWLVENGTYQTNLPLEIEKEYIIDELGGIKVVFHKLQSDDAKLFITKSNIKEVDGEKAISSYEITSNMEDGTFLYDLYLPAPNIDNADNVEVQYSEDGVVFRDVENEQLQDGYIVTKDLDHFTVFVVVTPNPAGNGNPSADDCSTVGVVGDPVCYDTIQDAINAASDGDTINVKPGTYQEQLTISKSLNLVGVGNPSIVRVASPSSYSVAESSKIFEPIIFVYGGTLSSGLVSGAGQVEVSVSGFDIDGNNSSTSGKRSVAILSRNMNGDISGNNIHDMHISINETFGVVVYGDSNMQVTGNTIAGYSRGGISISGDNGAALDPVASVTNNEVFGPGADEIVTWAPNGIQVGYGASGVVSGNTVTGNGWPGAAWAGTGILAVDTSNVVIENNVVQDNEQAIGVVDFPEIIYGSIWSGIVSNIDVLNNTVTSNDWGLAISNNVSDITVTGNSFSQIGGDAIDVYVYYDNPQVAPPSGVIINNNSIESAGVDGLWVGDTVTEQVQAEKNWWGDATGPSGDASGSGQTIIGNASYCPWLTTNDLANPSYGGDCLGSIQGRTFIDKADNGLLLTADGDYPDGMKDGFTVRVYDDNWDILEEQTTNTTGNVGQYNFTNLLSESNTYRVCGVQANGYMESVPVIGQSVVKVDGGTIPSEYADALIIANGSAASDEFSRCWETVLDNNDGAYLGVGYELSAPVQTGYNVNNGDDYATPRPPANEIACTNGVTNINGVSVHWTHALDGILGTLKYERQYKVGNGNWYGSEIYTNPYTNYRTFGGGSGNDGTYGSQVRAWDDADGNNIVDPWETVSDWSNACDITFDKTAPTAPEIITPTPEQYFNNQPILGDWTDSTDANGIDKYQIEYVYDDEHSFTGGPYRETPGTQSWRDHTPALSEQGGVTIRVRAYDPAGNASDWSNSVHYYFDTISPSTPEVLGFLNPALPCGVVTNIHSTTVDWTNGNDVNGVAGYNYWIDYPKPDGTRGTWTTFKSTSQHGGALNEGISYIKVQAVDNAGNVSGWTSLCDITADWTNPNVTIDSVELIASSGTYYTTDWKVNDNTPTLVGTVSDDIEVASVTVNVNGNDYTAVVTGNDWKVDVTDILPDGIHTITAIATDTAGNTTSTTQDILIDTIAPNITLDLPTNGAVLAGGIDLEATCDEECDYINFWWRADGESYSNTSPKRNYHYILDNGTSFTWTLDSLNAERWGGDPSYPLADGTYYFYAAGKDVAGNWARTAETMIVIDNTAPEQVLGMTIYKGTDISGDNLGCSGFTNDRWITVDWNDSTDPNFKDYRYQTMGSYFDILVPSQRTGQISDQDGQYKYQIRANDKAGNTGEYSDWCYVTLDREAPDVDLTTPTDGSLVNGTVNIEGLVTDLNNHHYWLVVQDSSNTTIAGPGVVYDTDPSISASLAWDTTSAPDGEYTIKLEARDSANNKDDGSVEWATVTVDNTAPVTSELTSPVNTSFWGTPITITGETSDFDVITGVDSGVDYVNISYRLSGETSWTPANSVSPIDNPADNSPFAWTTDWTPPAEGVYDIRAAGMDMAGNEESSVYALNVTYDVTVPTTVNAGPDRGDQSAPFSQTGIAADSNSGIYMTVWSKTSGPGEVLATGEDTLTPTFSADTDGIYVVRLTATDNAGNSDFDEFTFNWIITTDGGTGIVDGGTPLLPPTGEDNNVLGDTTNATTDTGNVSGDSDQAATQGENDGCFDILGLCWYWWVVIVTATGLVYYLYRVFKEDDDDDEEK